MKILNFQVTDRAAHSNLEELRKQWRQGFQSPLARRFVFLTILCSTALALLMTTVQLFFDYKNEVSVLDRSIKKIEQSMLPGLIESVWIIDDALVRSQLDGMIQIDGVEFVQVVDPDGVLAAAGDDSGWYSRRYDFPMARGSGTQAIPIGTLQVMVSLSGVYDRLIRRTILILLTNTVKTFVVAGIILLIYQILIGKHISTLAAFASTYDPNKPASTVDLKRHQVRHASAMNDELAQLELAVNQLTSANRRHIQDLQDTNREQAEFTYAISHDLKAPIISTGMLLNEIRDESREALGPDAEQMLGAAQQTIGRMGQQIDSVLDYSRSITTTIEIEAVDLGKVTKDIIDDLQGLVQQSDARIETGDLPLVSGNPTLLAMLLQNLITNALKFCPQDRTPHIKIGSTAAGVAGMVRVSIADNGIGIDPKHHDRIFGLFKRLHLPQDYPGSGIGLALCQRIVKKHGGSINISSEPSRGTVFHVDLRKA